MYLSPSYPLPHLISSTTLNTLVPTGLPLPCFFPPHLYSCRHIQHFAMPGIIHHLSGLQDVGTLLLAPDTELSSRHKNDARIIVFPGRESAQTCADFKHQISLFVAIQGQLSLFRLCSGTRVLSELAHCTERKNYRTSSLECLRETFGAAESTSLLGEGSQEFTKGISLLPSLLFPVNFPLYPSVYPCKFNLCLYLGTGAQKEWWEWVGREAQTLCVTLKREFSRAAIPFCPLHHTPSALCKVLSVTPSKNSTCFQPTGAWAASPALPHPSISVPRQKFLPHSLPKGAPNTLHFAGTASNKVILKYLWLAVQEQWHAGNVICFSAP